MPAFKLVHTEELDWSQCPETRTLSLAMRSGVLGKGFGASAVRGKLASRQWGAR